MVNKLIVAIFLSLVCNAFALDSHYSPVLIFKHKENSKSYDKSIISATTKVEQREFEQRFEPFDEEQKVIFFVLPDMSPEDLALKNKENVKAFQNIASGVDMVDYMLFVQNAADNKVTQGENVAHTSVSTINELEPEPSSDTKISIVKLPERHMDESHFHWLQRMDRAVYAISQLPQYKDYLFILTSEVNSRLEQQHEEHSRKRRAADLTKPYKHSDDNILFYAKDYLQDFKKDGEADAPIAINAITTEKNGNTITLNIDSAFPLSLKFDYDPNSEYWTLNETTSTVKGQSLEGKVSLEIGAPKEFSFSCGSATYFSLNDTDTNGVYFSGFQVQPNYNSTAPLSQFSDSYDCTGFTSPAIWAGLFITFLLLGIVSTGISYIMDIRTMDRFDDPKGKTITVTASD